MKASRVIADVIGGVIAVLLLLLPLLEGGGNAALLPPEASLEPPRGMGDGQPLLPLEFSLTPQNRVGDGQQPPHRRRRRHGSHFPLCSYCCNCCRNRGCGLCCRT